MSLHQDLEELTPSAYQAEIDAYLNYHGCVKNEVSFEKTEIEDGNNHPQSSTSKEKDCNNRNG